MDNELKVQECPVCLNGKKFSFVSRYKENNSLYECAECKTQFWVPFIGATPEWYMAEENYRLEKPKVYRGYHKYFIKKYFENIKNKVVLDLGCGTGEFLDVIASEVKEYCGVDVDKVDIERARQLFGLDNLHASSFFDFFLGQQNDFYDFITAFEVVEHIDKPLLFFENISRMIKPNGRIVISMPYRDRMWADMYDWDYPPFHLSRWNEESVNYIASKAGLEVESVVFTDIYIHFYELVLCLFDKLKDKGFEKYIKKIFRRHTFVAPLAAILFLYSKILGKRNGVMITELRRK